MMSLSKRCITRAPAWAQLRTALSTWCEDGTLQKVPCLQGIRAVQLGAGAERHSYVQGSRQPPLLEETIGSNLKRTATLYADNLALLSVHQNVRLSYAELQQGVDEIAKGLLAAGVQRRDRVGIWAANCAEWAVLQYAAAKVGAVLVAINPAYRSAELAFALTKPRVSMLVLDAQYRGASLVEMLQHIDGEVPFLRTKVLLTQGEYVPAGWMSWNRLREAGWGTALSSALVEREASLDPADPVSLQFTSGTTGTPKAAALSHRNVVNNGYMVMGNLACSTNGAAMVYPAPSFDADATLRAVHQEKCTSLYGVPTMFIAELEHPNFSKYNLESLRTGIMAGSPCPAEVMRRVREDMHMEEISCCYGMTELSPVCFQTGIEDPVERRISTVGRIHPHLEASVIDPETGRIVPRGTRGEICVRGYSVMQSGYWEDAAATERAIDAEGWMHTGDLGLVDADGWASICGRIKDTVIRGGENLFPAEIESYLHQHDAIADVQVFGVPDEFYGEELCAWIRLRGGNEGVTAETIRGWCRERISHHKVPRYIKVTEHPFPSTTSGKPQKFILQQKAIEELGLTMAGSGERKMQR